MKNYAPKAGRIRVVGSTSPTLVHQIWRPSDYHLFRSLRNHLFKKQFDDQAQLKSDLENFFSSLSRKFFEDGILDLPNRWEYVIDNNGIYVVD